MKDVIIIGGGIAGLSAALELQKDNVDFELLEKSNRVGGNIESLNLEGHLVEKGPYTFTSSSKEIFELINDLDLKDELIESSDKSVNRYVYFQKQLMKVPMSIQELYKTDLLSKEGKKTLLEEFFIPKVDKEETVEEFISRRFGREILKNLVQPFLCGVFAGDVQKLSANSVFPKLKELERKYNSILAGIPLSKGFNFSKEKHALYSFKQGMEVLPKKLAVQLGRKINYEVENIEIARAKDYFVITFTSSGKAYNYTTNAVLFATPAGEVLNYSHLLPNKESQDFFNIDYTPIATVAQTIKESKVKMNLDGFGFLCTKEPHRKLLGSIWTSSIFPNRSNGDEILFNSFIGGAYHPKVTKQSIEEIADLVSRELVEILKLSKSAQLKTINVKLYEKAIPQYAMGHVGRLRSVEEIMDRDFGLFFTGNYLYGISINDTVKTSKLMANRIKRFLQSIKGKKG